MPSVHESQLSRRNEEGIKRKTSKKDSVLEGHRRSPKSHLTPYSTPKSSGSGKSLNHYYREHSISPLPLYNYSYSLPKSVIHAPYPQHSSFNTLLIPFPDYSGQPQYLLPLSTTLPSITPYKLRPLKHSNYLDKDILRQYETGYTPFAGINLSMQPSYQDSDAYVIHPECSFRFH